MKFPIFLLLSLFLALNSSCEKKKEMYCYYADGSGNVFKLHNMPTFRFEYVPVTPETSSSGEYSGGEPVSKNILKSEFMEVKKLIEAVLADEEAKLENRNMGTGLVSLSIGEDTWKEVVDRNRDSVKELEGRLQELRRE